MGVQYDKICALLTETVMLMCKNGVQYNNELKVQGLIGLTADKDVYIIQIDELVKAEGTSIKQQRVSEGAKIAHSSNHSTQADINNQEYCVQNLSSSKNFEPNNHIYRKQLQILDNNNDSNNIINTSNENCLNRVNKINNVDQKINFVTTSNGVKTIEYNSNSQNSFLMTTTDTTNTQNNVSEIDFNNQNDRNDCDQIIQNEVSKFFEDNPSNIYQQNNIQDYPIDLHVNNSNDYQDQNSSQANNTENSLINYDIKPSVGELKEWATRNEFKINPSTKKRRQSKAAANKKLKESKIKNAMTKNIITSTPNDQASPNIEFNNDSSLPNTEDTNNNNTDSINNNNTDSFNNNNNSQWDVDMQGMEGGSAEWNAGGDYDMNNNAMVLNSSKYHCNICTSSYKHYCNLLTHEVKVHGRQKKRGGRKRKNEAVSVYEGEVAVSTEDITSVPRDSLLDDGGLNMTVENVEMVKNDFVDNANECNIGTEE